MLKPSCSMYTPGLFLLCFLHRWYWLLESTRRESQWSLCDVFKRGWWHSCLHCLSKTDRLAAGWTLLLQSDNFLGFKMATDLAWFELPTIEGLIIGKLFNRFLMCCPFSVISFLFLASPLARCQQKISSTACLQRWLKNRLASTGTAWLMIPWVYCVASLVL